MRLSPAVRLSEYFMPTLKENPSEAEIASHRLMLRAGMIRQASAGIYSWLPLGFRVLKKIEQIVREEQDTTGAHEVLMPTVQSADLWRKSGRYDDYGKEMLRIQDRHEREMLYGPTNEELITDIFRDGARSYKDVPQMLYHIQWKFRDEVRPRFGVMRGREFLMKDGYSFDLSEEEGKKSYNRMFVAYLRTYARMGLQVIPMRADTGPIGGENSHEFIILAETGESQVFCNSDVLELDPLAEKADYKGDLQPIVNKWTAHYAATEEMHDEARFEQEVPADKRVSARGIEVGHIFFFGDKYSTPLGAMVTTKDGEQVPVQMGSYGIGVSRLAGAIIEACHDENGIIWPESVAPFKVGLINLRSGDDACDAACEDIYGKLQEAGVEVMYDDRSERAGVKFANMDLIGLPWQLVVGPKGVAAGVVELKSRKSGEKQELPLDKALELLAGK
ncbi:proline--tRNA ligase [Aestuariispira ectoiniformans]|uniref:proline--tRNA ligase n=1 Tax=Aestuariispira ectoiniformans TaxID=2775080 RepID=UPI00223C15B2|nr:proline--tRNA ligase [Aestuariispira ectoiniformans]